MALYINGRPVNPIVTFLVSAVVLAGIVGLGILLLPIIGALFVVLVIVVACIALYGMYSRWRYGDPFARMQKQAEEILRRRAAAELNPNQPAAESRTSDEEVREGQARTGVKRTTVVEDAVVVEEIRRKDI